MQKDTTWRLLEAERLGEWFAYNVRLKLRNGKFYAQVSWEEKTVEPVITKAYGVMGIDINAYPFHLALAYVSMDGNLEKFERIDLREMEGKTQNQREHIAWRIARQVVERALESGKAIVVEDLQKVPKGRRGDGLAKLRRKLHKWAYRSVLEKIEVYARRLGVQLIKVNPAYTSIIGKLKYSPMLGIDKDVAGAYVIGRRGLRYLELLLSYTRDSGKSEPATQQAVNREMKPMRGRAKSLQKSWRVLSVALAVLLATPCFEWCRDHSPLKRVLISEDWARVADKGSPSLPGQGTAASPCSFIHSG